jgi:hypothetical protein
VQGRIRIAESASGERLLALVPSHDSTVKKGAGGSCGEQVARVPLAGELIRLWLPNEQVHGLAEGLSAPSVTTIESAYRSTLAHST